MNVDKRLEELSIVVPRAAKPLAAYVPAVVSGPLVFVSGQLPIRDGKLVYCGKVGVDLSLEEGQQASRLAVINCLSALNSIIDDWNELKRIVKITGYIQCREDFADQHLVLNGASDLLEQIFADQGRHARAAVGVNALPLNAACEVEMIAELITGEPKK